MYTQYDGDPDGTTTVHVTIYQDQVSVSNKVCLGNVINMISISLSAVCLSLDVFTNESASRGLCS